MSALQSRRAVGAFLIPALLVYFVAVFVPIMESVALSLASWDGITSPLFVGFNNYARLLAGDSVFWRSFGNSLVYLVVVLLFQLGLGLALANLLTYVGRGREVIKTFYFLPTIVSTVAIAFLFQRIYAYEPPGLINLVLGALGLGGLATPWLSNVGTALTAVSIPEGWRFMGLYTVILYAALLSVPKEIEEAARIDGASEWRVFLSVRFPSIRPVWVTTMIMAATYGLRGFDIPYLLTNGGPGQATELLTTYMYKVAFRSTEFGYASTIAVFIVVECLVAVGLILRLLRTED
jgi:raffinose/stachyose/melibiose transport system permease protein